jgi:hypothetical protein
MTYKASIQVGDKTVTFEGPREFVEDQVSRYVQADSSASTTLVAGPLSAPHGSAGSTSAKELVEAKRPAGHPETATVLAFWLVDHGVPEFTEEDIRKAYIRAGIRPPKVVSQAIRDAKNRFDYIELGSRRGTYRLTAHGDRTVRFDLPRG